MMPDITPPQGLQSVACLTPRLDAYFASRGILHWSFVSMAAPFTPVPSGVTPHLVLLGDAPYYLSFFTHWRWTGQFYLWTLSTALRDLLVNVGGIPSDCIGVISRYDLYPLKPPLYPLRSTDSLVYAGRDVPGKQLPVLRKLAAKTGFALYECGPEQAIDHGETWTEKFLGRPAFISLSHYRFEDFSVAAAQAQAAGLPVICPQWYGFKDIQGPADAVLKLTAFPELLGDKFDEEEALSHWAQQLAAWPTSPLPSSSASEPPRSLNSTTLAALISVRQQRLSLALYEYFTPAFSPKNLDSYAEIISNMI